MSLIVGPNQKHALGGEFGGGDLGGKCSTNFVGRYFVKDFCSRIGK